MSGEWISPLNRSTAHINGTPKLVLEWSIMNLSILRTLYIIPTLILYDPRFDKCIIIHPHHYFRKLVFVCRMKNSCAVVRWWGIIQYIGHLTILPPYLVSTYKYVYCWSKSTNIVRDSSLRNGRKKCIPLNYKRWKLSWEHWVEHTTFTLLYVTKCCSLNIG